MATHKNLDSGKLRPALPVSWAIWQSQMAMHKTRIWAKLICENPIRQNFSRKVHGELATPVRLSKICFVWTRRIMLCPCKA
jgi:hypothetical protein